MKFTHWSNQTRIVWGGGRDRHRERKEKHKRNKTPPAPGSNPSFTSGRPICPLAVREQTREEHARASSRPPPKQFPYGRE